MANFLTSPGMLSIILAGNKTIDTRSLGHHADVRSEMVLLLYFHLFSRAMQYADQNSGAQYSIEGNAARSVDCSRLPVMIVSKHEKQFGAKPRFCLYVPND